MLITILQNPQNVSNDGPVERMEICILTNFNRSRQKRSPPFLHFAAVNLLR